MKIFSLNFSAITNIKPQIIPTIERGIASKYSAVEILSPPSLGNPIPPPNIEFSTSKVPPAKSTATIFEMIFVDCTRSGLSLLSSLSSLTDARPNKGA